MGNTSIADPPASRLGSRQVRASERVKYGKVRHETRQTPASGDTNSRKGLQVAGIRGVLLPPLDQESPGSSPGGTTGRPGTIQLGGKKLFADGSAPHSFKLTSSRISPNGLIIGHYERGGEIKIGDTAVDSPSDREVARRERMKREN
jgi:hypothetical protein